MNKFSILCISLAIVSTTFAEFNWDFGGWSPILGRCKTCERGRLISLQRDARQLSGDLSVGESRNNHRQSSANRFSLVPADVYPLETKAAIERDTNRVQLVYLPEGSINDLRSARLVKVKEGLGRIQVRPVRATSHPTGVFQAAPLDIETSDSTISFRQISPRRPTALVAEQGREREAREQIQLLEAALNARPNNVREGELPRVFIAPTHLAPPPGYVKIPLLPSENHVGAKKVLPGTFLTSEVHNHLPPGFVQVPLSERVAQLSHGIPFVNPDTHSHFQSHIAQQNRQQSIQQNNDAQNLIRDQRPGQFREQQTFNVRQPVQENTGRQFNRGQTQQQRVSSQDFNRGPPAQESLRTGNRGQEIQQEFERGQQFQQDTRRQPSQRDFNSQPVQQDFRGRQPASQDIDRGQPGQRNFNRVQPAREQFGVQQQRNELSPEQSPNFNPDSTNNEPALHQQENFPRQETTERLAPSGNDEQRFGDHPTSENIPRTDSNSNTDHSSFRQEPDPFGDYGSSVGSPSNSFDDYSFSLPDYEQLFDAYDTPDFDFPDIVIEPETEAPVQPTEVPAISEHEARVEEGTEQSIHPEDINAVTEQSIHPEQFNAVTEAQSETEIPSTFAPVLEQTIATEPTVGNRPNQLKLFPRPVGSIPTLSPKPVESLSDQSENIVTDAPASSRILPKPIDLIGTPVIQSVQDQSVRGNSRRRLRPGNARGRLPNINRHRLNLKTTENPAAVQPAVDTLNAVQSLTTTSPNLLRTRSKLGIRRRRPPIQQESTQPETNVIGSTTIAPSSTLFPSFAVAKKLHEKSEASAVEQPQQTRRGGEALSRGRFGSRLRPRIQELSDNKNEEVVGNNNIATPQGQAQGTQRRRVRTRGRGRRVRGPNGRPLRRRVLNRVRKINPEEQNNALAGNELRAAESARVSFSRAPVNKVADPITQALELISNKGEKTDTESVNEKLKTESSARQKNEQASDKSEDIFHLLNFDNLKQENSASSTLNQNAEVRESSSIPINRPFGANIEGYVNDGESLSETKAFVEPIDAEIVTHDSTPVESVVSEPNSDPFNPSVDVLPSFTANTPPPPPFPASSSSINNIAPTPSALASNKLSPNQLKHLTTESTIVTEFDDTLSNTLTKFDNTFSTLLPEDAPGQDNVYSDYDNEQIDTNNTYLGSSAHIVYAVALSDEHLPESSTTVSETTIQPSEQEMSVSVTESSTDATEDTTLYSEQLDSDVTDLTVNEETTGSPAETNLETELEATHELTVNEETTASPADTNLETELEATHDLTVNEETTASPADTNHETETNVETEPDATHEPELEPQSELEPEPEPQSEPQPASTDETTLKVSDTTAEPEVVSTTDLYITTTEANIIEETTVKNVDEPATHTTPTNKQFTTTVADTSTKLPTDKPKSLAEALAESLTKESKKPTTALPNSFLENFFSRSKESKNAVNEVTDTDNRIIGKSTITEVRSSQPMICIEGNCVNVIGENLRKR